MKTGYDWKASAGKESEGTIMVFVALSMVLILGMVALAVDIGNLYATRNELQNVADAAALAGARYLGAQYSTLDPSQMGSHAFTKE
mgnify:CR=1 FL=1